MQKSNIMPLVKELKFINESFVDNERNYRISNEILKNLIHTLRYYQKEAIQYFHYTQFSEYFKHRNVNHVLFNMATGSGKTDLMAALILYLFREKSYQNFVFTVNTKSVLNKTIENLLDKSSEKYLFKENIEIDGERIYIKQVKTFPSNQDKNTIYIILDTIQAISSDMFTEKEGAMREGNYSKYKTVVLGDEAHHYSSNTKSDNDNNERAWENTINIILNAREDNLLLEFTATIDLENKNIFNKYKDKVIYQYELSRYMFDKYSKNIRRIQSGNSDIENMMNAVLLSEYRRLLAIEKFNIRIKPVIMFKSQLVADSNASELVFNKLISSLNKAELLNFINKQIKISSKDSSETMKIVYDFYLEKVESLDVIINNIKKEFSPYRVINANDSSRSQMLEMGQYQALNSLESPENLFRVVFAVAKLTEGWDVLNLYDIVRLSDSPKAKGTKNWTNSEAQLIGRGARYNPFKLEGEKSYTRRFVDFSKESLILETLHYHTINEPQYLKNLVKSLDELNLPTDADEKNPLIDVIVKPSFKRSKLYKEGKIYYNNVVDIPDEYYSSLKKYGIDNESDITINWSNVREEFNYYVSAESTNSYNFSTISIPFDKRYWLKALAKNTFYKFSNLNKFIPQLNSISEFFNKNWLNVENRKFYVRVAEKVTLDDLSPKDKLSLISQYLKEIENKIKSGYSSKRGTNEFIGYPIKEYIVDYRKRVPKYDSAKIFTIQHVDNYEFISDSYAYKNSIINMTEKQLIDRVLDLTNELKLKYNNVYLVRMDENMHRESVKSNDLKLYQFDESPEQFEYAGFQPDFILLLVNEDYYIQIFIEPKGENRYFSEKWKEDLLNHINENEDNIVINEEINNTKIKGLKFYFSGDTQGTINQLKEIVLK